jgi:ABC-type transport system substrate-binding protein
LNGICEYYFWGGREESDYWYYNQELVDLLSEVSLETDPDRIKQILKNCQEILVEDMPAIWILDLIYKSALRSNVQGFVYNSMLEMTFNVYDMWKE